MDEKAIKAMKAEHDFQVENLPTKTFVDYCRETGRVPDEDGELMPIDEQLAIQDILACEIMIYLLKRKCPSKSEDLVNVYMEKWQDLVSNYELDFATQYTQCNNFELL